MELAVSFDSVSKTFRRLLSRHGVEAVRDLTLEIPRGEIVGLLGPNGSGKTTSICMMLGLLRPTAGTIRVFGAAPGSRAARARIGFLPEEFQPPDLLRGEEILRYYGGFHRIPRAELRRRVDDYLERLDMSHARRRRFRDYSKGMQRRIGLAQAMLHEPDLLVLDEPTNGLDPIGVAKVKSMLMELKEKGRTVLVCSHVLPEIEGVCDRLAILHRGSCITSGRTAELLHVRDRLQVTVDVPASGDEDIGERARRALASGGLSVRSVEPARVSLEEVFMERVREVESE